MQKRIECVPNVSEGRDKAVLDELSRVVRSVPGVSLLDVDPGAETNRTVYTFVGAPDAVAEAAFQFIKRAGELVDMSKHKGAHARIGATDVCPFVPLSGVTMEECVQVARKVGERVGKELLIPVYLYEAAATKPERKNLADIRKGEYEGLKAKLASDAPDFGPASYGERQAKTGASVIGARPFLVAYNVNINSKDKKHANDIAFSIRESGRTKTNEKGEKVTTPGTLKAVKGTGWVIEEYGCAQVSMNLTDLGQTSLATAFEECLKQADRIGVRVTGSELVGLIPKDELIAAGKHFLKKMGKPTHAPERDIMRVAVRSLGLNELGPFDLDKKVIEYVIAAPAPLAAMTVSKFVDEMSSESPAPGGGSAAALCGALGGALCAMVATLTEQKDKHADMPRIGEQAQQLKARLVEAIDADTAAFNEVLNAMRMPKATAEEQTARNGAMECANQGATLVPLEVMRASTQVVELALELTQKGFKQSLSDAGVGALAAMACVEGAYYNVKINLPTVQAADFKAATLKEADALLLRARQASDAARQIMLNAQHS